MWIGLKALPTFWTPLLLCLSAVHANTEIINFSTKRGVEDARAAKVFYGHKQVDAILEPPKMILRLNTTSPDEQQWRIGVLLDEAAGNSAKASWTARVSWPATMPSDFDIRVVPWRSSDRKTAVSSTHDRLITITRRYTGVPFPSESVLTGWSEQAPSNLVGVTFDLIVEPLSFGIVPYTAWPTIFSVVMMAFLGYLFATRFVLPRLLDPLLTRADAKTE